jgi:hypothetical protein
MGVCFIQIIAELLPQGVLPRYEYDGDIPIYYIDKFNFTKSLSFLPTKGKFKITLPTFGMTGSNIAIIESVKCAAAKLAYTSGHIGHIIMAVTTFSFSSDTSKNQDVIQMSMCYVPGEYEGDISLVMNLPDQVDLCEYFPDADIRRMEGILSINEVILS